MNVDPSRRDAWLAKRRQHITSTDLASIMELEDAYSSPMGVFLSKKDLEPDRDVTEVLEWGIRLQEPIIEAAADRLQQAIEHADPYELYVHPERQVLAASLDAIVLAEHAPLDGKNVGFLKPDQWGPDGSDEIPPRFVVQLHGQMAVTGAQVAYLSALFGGRHLRVYRLERDEEIIAGCLEAAESFWTKHVLTGIPPAVDGSEEWSRFLGSRAQRTEALYMSTPELDRWAEQLRQARAALEQAEAFEKEARNHIIAAIGDGAGVRGATWKATYRASKVSAKTDWEAVAKELLRVSGLVDTWDAALRTYTVTRAGSRRFLPTFNLTAKKEAA